METISTKAGGLNAKNAENAKRKRKGRDGAIVIASLCASFAVLAVKPLF
jgi:hypothetical protein